MFKYIKETKNELKHVSWPTRKQATGYTILVIIVAILVAYFLGAFDLLFTFLLEQLIIR